MRNAAALVALTILFTAAASAGAGQDTLRFSSGPARVAFVELFTSEGCSSCPPAERWLGSLEDDPGLWRAFVPVAFHVDYWDYIGWRDRYARAAFGQRQRLYAEEGGARYVYTPGVFVNGREWHGWRSAAGIEASGKAAGTLEVAVDGGHVAARFRPAGRAFVADTVHVAILGMDLETRVRAGENNGRTLHHDFVVLGTESASLEPAGNGWSADLALPASAAPGARQAIVTWVSGSDSQAPLQAAGAFLPGD